MNVLLDMETQDPDDLFALAFLVSRPDVNVRGVSITPGSAEQVGLIKEALNRMEVGDIPVGSYNADHPKTCISQWWINFLGEPTRMCQYEADHLYYEVFDTYPDAVLITGGPLKGLGKYLRSGWATHAPISKWVCQGGFAGDNIVPEEHRLAKFQGKVTCPTFNLNGDVKSALMAIESPLIKHGTFVSKNVCHGVVYDQAMHEIVETVKDKNAALRLMYDGMSHYLSKKPNGKIFHDPLAAAVAVNPSICQFAEVQLYREKGEWGSREAKGTNTFISYAVDKDAFVATLTRRTKMT